MPSIFLQLYKCVCVGGGGDPRDPFRLRIALAITEAASLVITSASLLHVVPNYILLFKRQFDVPTSCI